MGVYTIQTPDGRKVKIEAADEATAIRGAQGWVKSSPATPKPNGSGTRDDPFDLSGGQPRSSIPRSAYYKDPEGNLRRNDNGDRGNPIVKPASRVKAEVGARRDMATDLSTYAQRNALAPDRAASERNKSMAFIQGYAGLGDELRGLRSAVGTGVANLTGRGPGYSAREAYDARRAAEQAAYDQYRQTRPVESAVNAVGGALLNPLNVVAGEFIGPARAAGSVGRAAVAGGAIGAGYGAAGAAPGNRLRGAVSGGAVGAATGAVTQAGANALSGYVSRAASAAPTPARQLSRQGVQLTPGQMLGGGWQRAEDAATSIPLTGDFVRNSQRRGIESFNRVAMDRVLEPVGGAASDIGRAGMRDTSQQVSGAYQQALGGVTVNPDQQFAQGVARVAQSQRVPPAMQGDLQAFVGDVQQRLSGPVDGATWKAVDADLAAAIRSADAGSAQQPAQRFLRDALRDLRGEVGGLMERTDPAAYEAVRSADEATAMLSRVRKASQYTGTAARDGLFSPSDLNRAVQGMDTSAGNRQYGQGEALLQDLTDPAMQVLPRTVPDSGTPFRSIITGSPQGLVVTGLTSIPTAIIYSQPVQQILNALYRSSNGSQSAAALQQLAQLAARNPSLVQLYNELLARQNEPGGGQASTPEPQGRPTQQ